MHERANFKFRFAEQFAFLLANQQTCQGQQVAFRLQTQTRHEFLGLGFEFGAERLLQRHDALRS